MKTYVIPYHQLLLADLEQVGSKNAFLCDIQYHLAEYGIRVPKGFAVTVAGFFGLLAFNSLSPLLQEALDRLDRITFKNLPEVGEECRQMVMAGRFPPDLRYAIRQAYEELFSLTGGAPVAVRSSATAEDSSYAIFAGQHDSFLNVAGHEELLIAIQKCYASVFSDRAIKYRHEHGYSDLRVGMSVGVQQMVRADQGSAGVVFTLEPETYNTNLLYITGAWGLGEGLVQGAINTDEFYLFRPALEMRKPGIVARILGDKHQRLVCASSPDQRVGWEETPSERREQYVLSDEELSTLGNWSLLIKERYGADVDIEWAKDGSEGELFIVQSRQLLAGKQSVPGSLKEFILAGTPTPILTGKAVGHAVVSGKVRIVKSPADRVNVAAGDVVVTDRITPDCYVLMRKAACIISNTGGRTAHASILAREAGIPAIVGVQGATELLQDGQEITVCCASGDRGYIYEGRISWTEKEMDGQALAKAKVRSKLLLSDPGQALWYSTFPHLSVGLLRLEEVLFNSLPVHPLALLHFHELKDQKVKMQIDELCHHSRDKVKFIVDHLAAAIGLVAAAFYPREVVVGMSDPKANAYASLLGGKEVEQLKQNNRLEDFGKNRYSSNAYLNVLAPECAALAKVRKELLLENVRLALPICQTVEETEQVLQLLAAQGLQRKKEGVDIRLLTTLPANVQQIALLAPLFDELMLDLPELAQLEVALGMTAAPDASLLVQEAVLQHIRLLLTAAHAHQLKVGVCLHKELNVASVINALSGYGIDSVSFDPDGLLQGVQLIAMAEASLQTKAAPGEAFP